MKYYDLDDQENKILKDYEEGILTSVDNIEEEKKNLQSYAENTLQKTKNINIRLSTKDITKLKAKAARNGIPYQTLVSTLIHKYAEDTIKLDL